MALDYCYGYLFLMNCASGEKTVLQWVAVGELLDGRLFQHSVKAKIYNRDYFHIMP